MKNILISSPRIREWWEVIDMDLPEPHAEDSPGLLTAAGLKKLRDKELSRSLP